MNKNNVIEKLPIEIKQWLEQALTENHFTKYQTLAKLLKEKGYSISKSTIHRYGKQIQQRFLTIKATTEAAKLLVDEMPDEFDNRSAALIALIQDQLFHTLIAFQTNLELNPLEKIKILLNVARDTATLTRASITLKEFQTELKIRFEERMRHLESNAAHKKLDAETLRVIREEIYGLF